MYSRRSHNGGRRSSTSYSSSRRGRRNNNEFHLGRSAAQDDLVGAMGRMSILTSPKIKILPLSAYSFGPRDEPVAVAGDAVVVGERVPQPEDIPTNYPRPSAYLKGMQAHCQKEFEASGKQGVNNAERQEGGGWLPLSCRPNPKSDRFVSNALSFYVDGTPPDKDGSHAQQSEHREGIGHNFKKGPWSRHLVQFEGESVAALVVVCDGGSTDHQAYLAVARATGGGVPVMSPGLRTRVRSLGYAGSFLREYGSAAELLRRGGGGDNAGGLLAAVAAPGCGQQGQHQLFESRSVEGTFVPRDQVRSLDASTVPINSTQKDAVLNLTGGLDLIVGPPGTGKLTTIYHIIDSRVRQNARVLVTSIRNQAIDAVTAKVDSFGVLVFGNEARLGEHAKQFTMAGRMRNDPELIVWRNVRDKWSKNLQEAQAVSWRHLHLLPNFPGIARLLEIEADSFRVTGNTTEDLTLRKKGRAAGRWAIALESVMQNVFSRRLDRGNRAQKLLSRQLGALDKWVAVLSDGLTRVTRMLQRLEDLTRFRIFTKTRVLICTVDSTARMLRSMEEGTLEAANAIGHGSSHEEGSFSYRLSLDTAIMDEAACVLETAVPVVLSLGINNLTLVGDPSQLQPFSQVREDEAGQHHSRSLMERAIVADMRREFLDTQYRMHPRLAEIVSSTFYDNKLKTAQELKSIRKSRNPCKWVDVRGGEVKHKGRGYSNHLEVPMVVEQARAAMYRYGVEANIRVITFYNMQKRDLEREFKAQGDVSHIPIASVDSCQGSDADVVIISTVRSGDVGYRLSGFMTDRRRVNVAISRAKEECIIVGDKQTLRSGGGNMWRSVASHFETS